MTVKSNLSTVNNSSIYSEISTKETISEAISDILNEIVNDEEYQNENNANDKQNDIFSGVRIPSISIFDFLMRIIKYTNLEKSTLIIGLIYLDRFTENYKLNKWNLHRLLFTSLVIAIKYNEDDSFENNYYSKVCGISHQELYTLEVAFVDEVDFDLFVTNEVFEKYEDYLQDYLQQLKKLKVD